MPHFSHHAYSQCRAAAPPRCRAIADFSQNTWIFQYFFVTLQA